MSTMPEVGLPAPPQAPASHRVYGPSALGGGVQRFWSLTFMLARTEFKLRFFGSMLGYVWTLVRPLLFFGVMLFVFTVILEVNKGNPVPHYARVPARVDHPVHLLPGSHVRRRAEPRRAREPAAQGPLPAPGRAAVGSALLLLQPLHEPDRRVHLHPRRRHRAKRQLARADPAGGAARHPLGRRWHAAQRAVRALSRRPADLGSAGPAPVLRHRRSSTPYRQPRTTTSSASPSPASSSSTRSARSSRRRARPCFTPAPTAAQALGGVPRLAIPLGIIAVLFALGLWYFNREAPLISEKL